MKAMKKALTDHSRAVWEHWQMQNEDEAEEMKNKLYASKVDAMKTVFWSTLSPSWIPTVPVAP